MRWITLIAMLAACKPQLAPTEDTSGPTPTDGTGTVVPTPTPTPPPTPEPLTDPEAAGPQTFTRSVVELDVGTELPLRLRVHEPAQPDDRVALFLTGFSLAPDLYDSYSEHLASHGYVSIGVGLRTNVVVQRTQLSLAQDVQAVIDWVENDSGLTTVDASRIVIAGHSLGGKLALLTALEDSRVFGVIGLDPVDANPPGLEVTPDNPSIAPERMADIDFPVVFVGQDTNRDDCTPAGENYRDYHDDATSPAIRVEIEDADHMSFLDNPECGFLCTVCAEGTDDPDTTRSIAKGLTLAYFEYMLRQREGTRDYLIALPEHSAAGRTSVNVSGVF